MNSPELDPAPILVDPVPHNSTKKVYQWVIVILVKHINTIFLNQMF